MTKNGLQIYKFEYGKTEVVFAEYGRGATEWVATVSYDGSRHMPLRGRFNTNAKGLRAEAEKIAAAWNDDQKRESLMNPPKCTGIRFA